MKKFLFSIALLMSILPVSATNWEMVDTNVQDLNLYVDTDSLIYLNNDEYYYAIRYKNGSNPEKIAYIKYNSANNYTGVIQTGEYGVDVYKPQVVFRNAHVFMKPIPKNSFLTYTNEYIQACKNTESITQATPSLRNDNLKPVSYILNDSLQGYSIQTGYSLEDNWNPPKSGRNTQAVVVLTIGVDGSLQNYKFTQSSGDEATDRSIINAIEQSVPFMQYPRTAADIEPKEFQFTFVYKWLKKLVY